MTGSSNSMLVDAESDIIGLPEHLLVLEFDKQGNVMWDTNLFVSSVAIPPYADGKEALRALKAGGKRPLNGHFAMWLNANKDQIPIVWKPWVMLFMGSVISHSSFIYHKKASPEYTCPMMWFENGDWKIGLRNFSTYALEPCCRIPLLPH